MFSSDEDRHALFLMAEGRQGPQVKTIVGPHGVGGRERQDLETALKTGSAKMVAGAAIAAIAATNPVTAALYLAYRVAKYALPIAKEGIATKLKTGDSDQAVEAMKEETVKQVGKAAVDATVSAVSDAVVDGAVNATGVHATEPAKKFVSEAVSEAISEVIG